VRAFAAFGIDGFPSDQPRDDAVRRLLETELPPEPEPHVRARPPANTHRYVPEHSEAASTPKRLACDDRTRLSPFVALGGTPRAIRERKECEDDADERREPPVDLIRSRSTSPSCLERECEDSAHHLADHDARAEKSRTARSTSADPETTSAVAKDANRARPASASISISPRRARPAWGAGGGARRLEDPESPVRVRRRPMRAMSRSMDTALRETERARVASTRARAEIAAVERLRSAREVRESRNSESRELRGDPRGGPSPRASSFSSSASGTRAGNAGDRLYRRGVFERERRELERARETSGGVGGAESSRPFGMTNVSRALMTDARAFASRQRLFEAKRAESIELERLRAFTRDVEETRRMGKPRITASARAMTRTVEDLEAWKRRRDERIEGARRDLEMRETRELTFIPAIDARSVSIATKRNTAAGTRRPAGAWSPPKTPPPSSLRSAAPRAVAKKDGGGSASPRTPRPHVSAMDARVSQSHPGNRDSPKPGTPELARALAGAVIAGAAAMASVGAPGRVSAAASPAAGRSAPAAYPAPPVVSNAFGLTQVTQSETHDTNPPRTTRGSTGVSTAPRDAHGSFSLRNSVRPEPSPPHSRNAEEKQTPKPVTTTRAAELRRAARRAALEASAAKEAFRPWILANARSSRRPVDSSVRSSSANGKHQSAPFLAPPPAASSSRSPVSSVVGAVARRKETERASRSLPKATRTSQSGGWGAYGDGGGGWELYGTETAAQPPVRRSVEPRGDAGGHRQSTPKARTPRNARDSEGPPDRGARRSVQEAEARAMEAWGYFK